MSATGVTMGLAEWIIDDTYFVLLMLDTHVWKLKFINCKKLWKQLSQWHDRIDLRLQYFLCHCPWARKTKVLEMTVFRKKKSISAVILVTALKIKFKFNRDTMQNFIKIGPVVPELQACKVYYSHWGESLFSRPSCVQTEVRWPKQICFNYCSRLWTPVTQKLLDRFCWNFVWLIYDSSTLYCIDFINITYQITKIIFFERLFNPGL